MAAHRIRAVGLILANPMDEILILRERNPKPHYHKFEGMRSIPLETVQGTESLERALERLVEEEVPGVSVRNLAYQGTYWTPCPTRNVWNWVYTAQSDTLELPALGDEVDLHTWLDPEHALELWLRPAVYEMITDFRNSARDRHPHRPYRRVAQSEEEHGSLLTRSR